ncbi:flagellin modification protein A [Thiomicrospira aerophila AL3]|uniref:Flagellin modification protein A n=1 Tax=Thiomicrospira aerophila AL3 TaxID=717772 RepID=W0DX80_9GAMM|nr:oxidoreductase [Thiomicrospira aerophila]AHF01584.1 flagellin modification protein A [Thiomicrospira aerophila AL3]
MLNNQVVVLTGGAGLVGKAFIEAIAQNSGVAIIADISLEKGQQAKASLPESLQDNIDVIELDITNKESIVQQIQFLHEKYGRIDALVNNAYPRNKNYGRHFFDVEYEDFNENVALHLGGYFNVSKHFTKFFVEQGHGNIINISSIYGLVAPRFHIYEGTKMTVPVEYAVIKSGLNHLTEYMAAYLKDKNIRVNTLTLGGILDGQPESFLKNYREECLNKGMLNPEDIVGSMVYLLSEQSKYVNGQNIIVDDGFSI